MKIIELFSGIGASRLALENMGIKPQVLFVSEIDKQAHRVYEKMFGSTLNLGDIRKITIPTIEKFEGKCDLLIMGPPCQDFSQAGNNKGATEETRSGRLWDSIMIIGNVKPRIVILENVKGLVQRHRATLILFQEMMEQAGYTVNYSDILNAFEFGIPQNRERIFMVFSRAEANILNPICVKKSKERTPTLREFFAPPWPHDHPTFLFLSQWEAHNYTNFMTWTDKKGNKNSSYNRAWKIDKFVGTIPAQHPPKITDGETVWKLTMLDCWLLMGLPISKYPGKEVAPTTLIRLIGNSIVVPVIQAVLEATLAEYSICIRCYRYQEEFCECLWAETLTHCKECCKE